MTRIPIMRHRGTAMRTRLKLLTVGLVLVTAAVAGCSSTTAGPDGAIQDDVELAAPASAPASSSAGPTSSPDPVTPTAAPTEAPASPVASPTDSPSPSGLSDDPTLLGRTPPADVCDANMQYACGDIGQSGVGIVFYASSTSFDCGLDMDSSCNYLEVAPQTWNGDLAKCPGGCVGSPDSTSDWGSAGAGSGRGYQYCHNLEDYPSTDFILHAWGTVVGSGFANTSTLVTYCDVFDDAGRQVRRYTGGGMTDWSLPSLDELNALYYYPNRNAIGGFAASTYWSSSQANTYNARKQDFKDGSQSSEAKKTPFGLRPVRAF